MSIISKDKEGITVRVVNYRVKSFQNRNARGQFASGFEDRVDYSNQIIRYRYFRTQTPATRKGGLGPKKTRGMYDASSKSVSATALVGTTVVMAKRVASMGIDIQEAASGQSIRASNQRAILDIATNPVGYIVEATYGNWLRSMRVERSNIELSKQAELTGKVIHTKQYGSYR